MTNHANDIVQTYLAAMKAIRGVLDSFTATPAEKDAAEAALADLTTALSMYSVQRVEGRSALLTALIVELNGVIDQVRVNPVGDLLARLSSLVGTANQLLNAEKEAMRPTLPAPSVPDLETTWSALEAPGDMPDLRRLVSSLEGVLLDRMGTTIDLDEKAALEKQIAELAQLQLLAGEPDDMSEASVLSGLADAVDLALANLRVRPFDDIPGRLQELGDRIASVMGDNTRARVGAHAQDRGESGAVEPALPEGATTVPQENEAPMAEGHALIRSGSYADLKDEYVECFNRCRIRPGKERHIQRFYTRPLLDGRRQYESVGGALGIPWWFIGIIHGLEGSFNFRSHLHNGDPLTARTVHQPAGHPRTGRPPFSWRQSAIDALRLKKLDREDDWSLPRVLYLWEKYNGMGYRFRGVASPYLWSFSTEYEKGKYVRDGVFDPEAVSRQCGAATLLKYLVQQDIVEIRRRTRRITAEAAPTTLTPALAIALQNSPLTSAKKELAIPARLKRGAKDSAARHSVRNTQEWCCFHRVDTDIDGDFGPGTEDAVMRFQRKSGITQSGVVDERTWLELSAPMRRALRPIATDSVDSLYDICLRVARQHLNEHPAEVGGDNCGPWVRLYMNGKQGRDQPWCAGFVCFIVGQAALALDQDMPFSRQVGVDQLVQDAQAAGRFIAEDDLSTGSQRINRLRPGCLFAIRKSATDWIHTGIVTEIGEHSFKSIEGNTNDEGSRNGFEVCMRSRSYRKKDFILLV